MLTRYRKEHVENIHISMVLSQLPGIAHTLAGHARLRDFTLAHTGTLHLTDADDGCGSIGAYLAHHHTGLGGTYFQAYKDFRLSHKRCKKLRCD